MFGECIGVWLLHEWMKMGSPQPVQIVELGPGKGTLLNDVLRLINSQLAVVWLKNGLLVKPNYHILCSKSSRIDFIYVGILV